MSFLLYLVGYIILICGLAWAASTAGVDQTYIAIGATVLIGLGIITGVTRTRHRDDTSTSDGGSDVTVVKH